MEAARGSLLAIRGGGQAGSGSRSGGIDDLFEKVAGVRERGVLQALLKRVFGSAKAGAAGGGGLVGDFVDADPRDVPGTVAHFVACTRTRATAADALGAGAGYTALPAALDPGARARAGRERMEAGATRRDESMALWVCRSARDTVVPSEASANLALAAARGTGEFRGAAQSDPCGRGLVASALAPLQTASWLVRQSMALGAGTLCRAASYPVISFMKEGITQGCLVMRMPDGFEHVFGVAEQLPRAYMAIHDWGFFMRVASESSLGMGRAYVAGQWSVDDLGQLFAVLLKNRDRSGSGFKSRSLWTSWIGSSLNFLSYRMNLDNTVAGSRKNIHAHYDLSNGLFETFLDHTTMMYSCGYFRETPSAEYQDGRFGTLPREQEAPATTADATAPGRTHRPVAPGSDPMPFRPAPRMEGTLDEA